MIKFFRGWRRKVGCFTLVMALAFMAGWVRSLETFDFIAISMFETTFRVESIGGDFKGVFLTPAEKRWISLGSRQVDLVHLRKNKRGILDEYVRWVHVRVNSRWDFCGLHLSEGILKKDGETRSKTVSVSYPLIVLPLTLVSAFLLLSKPRQSNLDKITEPIPAEGT